MKIIIDIEASILSINGIARIVEFPIEYADLGILEYDSVNTISSEIIEGQFTMGNIIATSIMAWYKAIQDGVLPIAYTPIDIRLKGKDGIRGIDGIPGIQGIQGIRGINGDGSESISDPLAYYILAKT